MRIRTVTVGLHATVPNPQVPYSNVKPSVELTAEIADDENLDAIHKELAGLASVFLTQQIQGALAIPLE